MTTGTTASPIVLLADGIKMTLQRSEWAITLIMRSRDSEGWSLRVKTKQKQNLLSSEDEEWSEWSESSFARFLKHGCFKKQATILVSAIGGKVQFGPQLPVSSQLKPELKRPNHFRNWCAWRPLVAELSGRLLVQIQEFPLLQIAYRGCRRQGCRKMQLATLF